MDSRWSMFHPDIHTIIRKGSSMLKLKKFIFGGILLILFLIVVQCAPIFGRKGPDWERVPLTKKLLKQYSIEQEHIVLLQYYLSDQIELARGTYKNYRFNEEYHALELGSGDRGKIIFVKNLPGQYIRHDEKGYVEGWKFWKKKNRSRFIIHFEKPPINLEFIETDNGQYVLDTTLKKNNTRSLYFEGNEFTCIAGHSAILMIDTRQLEKINDPNRYIKGAPFQDEEKDGPGIIGILLGMSIMLLLMLFLDNSE